MLKVTCSILAYNYGEYLPAAIESCLAQTKGNYDLEVLIIDDGSTDNTEEICKGYTNKIRYCKFQNEGFAASLTRAVTYATGDIICFLDADDYFLPNKVVSVVEEFIKNSSLLMIFHDQSFINDCGELVSAKARGGNTSTITCRREASLDLLPAHNESFFHTLYFAGHGIHMKKILSHYRMHSSSMSRPKSIYDWKEKLLKMNVLHLQKLKFLQKNPPVWATSKIMGSIYCKIAANYNFIKMEVALNKGEKKIAYRFYTRMFIWDLRGYQAIKFRTLKIGISHLILNRYIHY